MSALALDSFEVVAGSRGARLARVAGRWEGKAPGVAALVIDMGRDVMRAPALPGELDAEGVWRSGFALPDPGLPEDDRAAAVQPDGRGDQCQQRQGQGQDQRGE